MLKESEEKYRLLYDNSMDAILLTSPDGSIQAANPAACAMFQQTEENLIRNGRDAIVDTADPRLPVALAERIRNGRFTGELTFLRKNGTRFPGEVSTTLFTDGKGKIRTSMIIRDISDRKQIEDALRESEELFRVVCSTTPTTPSTCMSMTPWNKQGLLSRPMRSHAGCSSMAMLNS